MRNLKKLLAVIVTVAMLASFAIPVFAEEEALTDAEVIETLGMIQGDGDGVTEEYLASSVTRMQAAIMFLRLQGLEDEALAYEGTDNFTDAGEVWEGGQAILAYLLANPDLGWQGVVAGETFEPLAIIDAQSYYKVMLEALGYKQGVDFEWAEVFEFAAEQGLSSVADVDEFIVTDLATATVEALKATVKDSESTLLETLVEDEVIAEDDAVAAGLMDGEPEDLDVDDVTALNLIQLQVEFNKEVDEDSATDLDNYKLDNEDNAVLTGGNIDLLDDGATVVITMGTEANQQETLDLIIEGVKDLDGNKLAKTTVEDIEFLDTTLPEAVSAEVVGNDTIKVTFSEPVNTGATTKSNYVVNDGDLYIKAISPLKNNTEVNVELYSALDEGEATIKIKAGVEDYAGFGLIPAEFTVDVEEDTEAPEVVGYKDAKLDSIVLIFNEDIEINSYSAGDIYHTNSSNTSAAITAADIDGNELTLDFTGNELPEGTAYIYILKDTFNDLWDNKNAKIMTEVEVTVDETAPVLDEIKVIAEDQIKLTFDENVADVDRSDFTVLDEDGEEVAIRRVTHTAGTKVVNVYFTEDLSGDYTIAIEDIEDTAGNEIVKTTADFTIDDLTAPLFTDFVATLYNAGARDQKVKVDFDEKMATDGNYSVVDLAKYVVGGYDLSDLDAKASIEIISNGTAVEITVPSTADDSDGIDLNTTMTFSVARVADAAGNYTASLGSAIAFNGAGNVLIKKAEAIDVDQIAITFDDLFEDFDIADIIIYVDDDGTDNDAYDAGSDTVLMEEGNVDPAKVATSIDKDGNTVVTVTLANDILYNALDASDNDIRVTTVAQGSIVSENGYGEQLKGDFNTAPTVVAAAEVKDKIAPAIALDSNDDELIYALDADANGTIDMVVIEYAENINGATISTLSYKVEDIDITNAFVTDGIANAIAGTTAAGNFVALVLDEDDVIADDTAYCPDVEQELPIKDANGNALDPEDEVYASMDKAGPAIISIDVSGATVTVLFSEEIDDTSLAAAGTQFTLGGTAVSGEAISAAAMGTTDDVVVLTLDSALAPASGETVTIALSSGALDDLEGNASTQTAAVTYTEA